MYTIKLKVNLKVGSGEVLSKGRVFRGPLKELPRFVQEWVEEKPPYVEITKSVPVVEVPELPPIKEIETKVPEEVVIPEAVKKEKAPEKSKPALRKKSKKSKATKDK